LANKQWLDAAIKQPVEPTINPLFQQSTSLVALDQQPLAAVRNKPNGNDKQPLVAVLNKPYCTDRQPPVAAGNKPY
jgi:hypothetical protein